jgi:hypothetical protein
LAAEKRRVRADGVPAAAGDAYGNEGDPMTDERNTESLMDETGLGLLPGLAGALGVVVLAMMTLLLIGSMWAVFGVFALVLIVTMSILAVVIALLDEDGQIGRRLRRAIPGLDEHSTLS